MFAIMAWYGFARSKYLSPYIKRLVSRTTGEVSESKLDYHVTAAGKETNREDVADTIRNVAHRSNNTTKYDEIAAAPANKYVRNNYSTTSVVDSDDAAFFITTTKKHCNVLYFCFYITFNTYFKSIIFVIVLCV